MSYSNRVSSSTHVAPFILPALTTLLGLTGLATGANALVSNNPIDTIRAFGLRPAPNNTARDLTPLTKALIHTYGIRNVGSGLTILGLTAFWKLQPHRSVARDIARRCLGLSLMLGTVVGVGDAVLVRNFAESVGSEEGEEARKASWGHAGAAVVIAVTGTVLFWI